MGGDYLMDLGVDTINMDLKGIGCNGYSKLTNHRKATRVYPEVSGLSR
jgi:pyruvate-formate lyase-activating enzyme